MSDPIEQIVAKALGNNNLVLGSKLKIWVNELGKPDLIVIVEYGFEQHSFFYTEFYWLNHGVAVDVRGKFNGLDSALGRNVTRIMIPTKKTLPSGFMRNRKVIAGNNAIKSEIEFERLLNANLDGTAIKNITANDIDDIYKYHDNSEHYYYDIPFPFGKSSVTLYCIPIAEYHGPHVCTEEIYLMSLNDADYFRFSNFLYLLKGLIELPYYVMSNAISELQKLFLES